MASNIKQKKCLKSELKYLSITIPENTVCKKVMLFIFLFFSIHLNSVVPKVGGVDLLILSSISTLS